jgi:adenine phosphoribosyltransferase
MMSTLVDDLKGAIRDVPDFPEQGILFKDITPLLSDVVLMRRVLDAMAADWGPVDVVVGMESRGFLFGPGIADRLNAGFAPARKAGKLPHATESVSFSLEYGTATLEMHVDAFPRGARVLIVDDLLATGGTAAATKTLIERLGGEVVGYAFVVELGFLHGRNRLSAPIRSILNVV